MNNLAYDLFVVLTRMIVEKSFFLLQVEVYY